MPMMVARPKYFTVIPPVPTCPSCSNFRPQLGIDRTEAPVDESPVVTFFNERPTRSHEPRVGLGRCEDSQTTVGHCLRAIREKQMDVMLRIESLRPDRRRLHCAAGGHRFQNLQPRTASAQQRDNGG